MTNSSPRLLIKNGTLIDGSGPAIGTGSTAAAGTPG
jgi:hypothetical protein